VDVNALAVDLLSVSAHKLYGPKGIGCLYVRGGTRAIALEPLTYGGGQEHGLRSGTTNVPGVVGFGEACAIAQVEMPHEMARLAALRDRLEVELLAQIDGLLINGRGAKRLPNTSSLTFPKIDADALLLNMPQLMLGTGSACTSGAIEPSHVLQAIRLSQADASSTIRVSLGRYVDPSDIMMAARSIIETYRNLANDLR
jgi:cysteine desulfurase